jgi:hypothetical protein
LWKSERRFAVPEIWNLQALCPLRRHSTGEFQMRSALLWLIGIPIPIIIILWLLTGHV